MSFASAAPSSPWSGIRRAALLLPAALVLATIVVPAAGAQTAPKIAVVDLDFVFVQSPLGKKLREDLSKLQDKVRGEIEAHAKKIDDLQAGLAGKSPEEQRLVARQQEDEQLAIRRLRDDGTRQASKMEADRRQEIEKLLQPIFAKVQEEQGYDLILNKTPGVVIFAKDSIEITDMILEKVNSGS